MLGRFWMPSLRTCKNNYYFRKSAVEASFMFDSQIGLFEA
jgi:hypothetical protein